MKVSTKGYHKTICKFLSLFVITGNATILEEDSTTEFVYTYTFQD